MKTSKFCGARPSATEPARPPVEVVPAGGEQEEAEACFAASFAEVGLNGRGINWRYWIESMPTWTAGEAARLMRGLDPDVFRELTARPKKTDLRDVEHATSVALQIQRLAERSCKLSDTPTGWLAWARKERIAVLSTTARKIECIASRPRRRVQATKPLTESLPLKRATLVEKHRKHWPSLESDLKDASTNGLARAKAGQRDWDEGKALEWARARNKLIGQHSESTSLDSAIRGMSGQAVRRHTLK